MERARAEKSLIDHFSALEDPRQRWKVVYPLAEIMPLVLCARLAGADDFVEMRPWGRQNLQFLRRFLPFARGIPSHDTVKDVINALDAELFSGCFVAWVESLREDQPDIIAIDGKTARRTHARGKGRDPLHLVSAWASRQRLVLGQEAVAAQSNEITAVPVLLERLALTGALVTIDAIDCQNEIAAAILYQGADYLLALKANRPRTYADVELYFREPPPGEVDCFEATDANHGRIEVRRHMVSRNVGWLFSDRRFPDEPSFPGLAAIAGLTGPESMHNPAQPPPPL